MILSDRDMLERVATHSLLIDPFDSECVQPSTYDVRLGSQFRLFSSHDMTHIDLAQKRRVETQLVEVDELGFVLHPGEFALASTVERFRIPSDLAAKLEGKSSLGRLGLVVHATAGYIDPGFEGQITFEMSNVNVVPIVLRPGIKVAQICFFVMSSPVNRPYGTAGNRYQGQMGPTESRFWDSE
jgi:dCTP deaminase